MTSLQTEAYASDFFDLRTLNEHISAKIESWIDEVQRAAVRGGATATRAFAVLGAAGGGKTHLFARLRRHCGPSATLVLLRPYFGAPLSPRDVLTACVDHLAAGPNDDIDIGASQLAMIGAHWLADDDERSFPSMVLDDIGNDDDAAQRRRLDAGVARVLRRLPRSAAAAHIIHAVLTVACAKVPPFDTLAWLAGRDHGQADRPPLSEADVLQTLQIVATMAAPVAPLVLVLDQLENLASSDGARVVAYGSVVSELVDVVPNLTIVQLALTSEWRQHIEPHLSLPHRTRVANDVAQLASPSREQRLALLESWHASLVASETPTLQFPAPLAATELEELLAAPGMTPRLLLQALLAAKTEGVALSTEVPIRNGREPQPGGVVEGKPASAASAAVAASPVTPDVATPWQRELDRAAARVRKFVRAEQPVDSADLAEGLAAALAYLYGATIEQSSERATREIALAQSGATIHFVLMNGSHHSSATAALTKAVELAKTAKVALVRESRCQLPDSWASIADRRAAFERLPNARWLWIDQQDVTRLLALAAAHSLARGKRWQGRNGQTLSDGEFAAEMAALDPPTAWPVVAAASRFVSDVPHFPGPKTKRVPRPRERAADVKAATPPPSPTIQPVTAASASLAEAPLPTPHSADRPAHAASDAPAPTSRGVDIADDADHQTPTVRQWLATGRQLATAKADAYRERVRRLLGWPRRKF